jgi:hypothetical protein
VTRAVFHSKHFKSSSRKVNGMSDQLAPWKPEEGGNISIIKQQVLALSTINYMFIMEVQIKCVVSLRLGRNCDLLYFLAAYLTVSFYQSNSIANAE